MKYTQEEINAKHAELNNKLQTLQTEYDEHKKKTNSLLTIIAQQVKNQDENIGRCLTTINEMVPTLSLH